MDPNLSQLDPKLREAYQRVLNGQDNQQAQNTTPTPPQNPVVNPAPTSTPPSSPVYESPIQQPPTPVPAAPENPVSPTPSVNPNPMPTVNPQPLPEINPNPVPQNEPTPSNPTPIAPQPASAVQSEPQPQPESQLQPQFQQPEPGSQPNMTPAPAQAPTAQNIGGSVAFNAGASTQTVVKKSGRSLGHILLGLGAVVFLLAYTFLWIFIFKIRLPFLPA